MHCSTNRLYVCVCLWLGSGANTNIGGDQICAIFLAEEMCDVWKPLAFLH